MTKFKCAFVGVLVLLVLAGLVYTADFVSPETYSFVFKEGGVVETLSAAGYFAAFALLLFHIVRQKKPAGWSLCVMILCFGFRELDFDKRFTTMGVFKARFYSSSEVMVSEKAIGVLVILALVVCLYYLIKAHARLFFRNLKTFDPVAITVFLALAVMGASKTLDGLPRKLKPLGAVFSNHAKTVLGTVEELLELLVPVLMIAAILGAFRSARTKAGASGPASDCRLP